MSFSIQSREHVPSSGGPLDHFKIVLAYQDQDSAIRGLRTCDRLASDLGKTFELNKVMWKFDLLNVPKMQQLATEDAATADMIIFAMHQNAELPEHVRSWIDLALSEAGEKRPRAVVALFSPEIDSTADSGLDFLRSLTKSHQVDFFSNIEGLEKPLPFSISA